ncbi:MAG: S8 family serine peptidase, partial [Bacteroidetes bacterium]|nr:S8 family serine peptidase [Bacteroidota bacterium]
MKRSLLLAILLLFIFQFSYTQNKWSYKYRSGESERLTELQGLQAFNGYNFFIVEFKELPQSDQQTVLKQNGVELLGYLDHKHYWARIQTNSLSEIKLNALKINRIAVPDNTLKSSPFFEALVNNAEPGSFVIKLWSKEDVPLLIQVLEKDFEISAAVISESRGLLEINTSTEQLNDILQLPPVAYIGPLARTAIPLLVNTINMNRVNALQSEDFGPGLSGEGVTVGLWDGGISGNHIDLNGRVQNIENSFININETNHATAVAGIIGGKGHRNTRVIGMAPEANIKAWTFDGDIIQEMNNGVDNESLNIINSSYMLNDYNDPKFEMCVYPGLYVLESAELDKMVRDNPTLTHTIANGNDQATCSVVGVPTRQGIPIGLQSAKNVINVGWIDQAETHVGGSNIGPTLDGRWKPEIISKGKVVTTTSTDNGYDNTQGSSFSAPNVAGTTALLYEWYFDQFGVYPNAALIRGVLCNTAEDLYTQNGASHIGPDFFHGFGRINGLRAYDVLQDGYFEEDALSNNQQKTFNINIPANVGSVNVALSWSDVEAIPGDLTPLVNNLDLTVVGPDSTYLPWVIFPRRFWISAQTGIDSINNIEQVTINDPIPGTYTITVTGTEIPFGPQDFAINYDIRDKGIELTHPIGGEQWVPGETQYIRWDHSRTGANFTIDMSYDDGATWTTIKTAGV